MRYLSTRYTLVICSRIKHYTHSTPALHSIIVLYSSIVPCVSEHRAIYYIEYALTVFGREFPLFIDNLSLIVMSWREFANSGQGELYLPKGD